MPNDIEQNLEQPGAAIGAALITVKRFPGIQVRLLNGIVCFAVVVEQSGRRAVQVFHVWHRLGLKIRG
jgi:hypothetical protein